MSVISRSTIPWIRSCQSSGSTAGTDQRGVDPVEAARCGTRHGGQSPATPRSAPGGHRAAGDRQPEQPAGLLDGAAAPAERPGRRRRPRPAARATAAGARAGSRAGGRRSAWAARLVAVAGRAGSSRTVQAITPPTTSGTRPTPARSPAACIAATTATAAIAQKTRSPERLRRASARPGDAHEQQHHHGDPGDQERLVVAPDDVDQPTRRPGPA